MPIHQHEFSHVKWLGGDGLRSGGGHGQVEFHGGGHKDKTNFVGKEQPDAVEVLPPYAAYTYIIKAK